MDEHPFFGGSDSITLGDIVAGIFVSRLSFIGVGVSLDSYPKLNVWCNRLVSRDSFVKTHSSQEVFEAVKLQVKERMKANQNR